MTELIDSIKLIKAYAWERHWKAQITAARDDELRVMIRDRVNGTLFTILVSCYRSKYPLRAQSLRL